MSDLAKQTQVTIDGEHDTDHGWLYTMTIQWMDGTTSDHELTLAWVDHEHLVGGMISPSVLAKSAALLACGYLGQGEMPARCDVSSLRRMIPDFDASVKAV
tara:strand:+ start:214506 stop:214808 length:303 start_codon:yes stop_codon:yes gene_type:complete